MDLFHVRLLGTQTAVHAEDLFVDDGHNWQAVEAIGERLPEFDVIPSLTLVVKSVDTVYS